MGRLDLELTRTQAHHRHEGVEKRMATERTTSNNVRQKSQPHDMKHKLRKAAEGGDVECFITTLEEVCIEQELQLDTVLNQTDTRRNTYLHVAAMSGRSELVRKLIGHGSDLLVEENNVGDTALHIAAKEGHLTITDLLSKKSGHQMDLKNYKGNTPLQEALIHNHQSLVDLLLHRGAYCSCYVNNEGESAIYLAVEAGNVKTFNAMLEKCWTSTHFDGLFEEQLMTGRSLLHAAISRKDKVMLQEILSKGMHMLLRVKDENEQTPIEFASSIGFMEGENTLRNELSKNTIDIGDVGVTQEEIPSPDSEWDGRHERMRKLLINEMLPPQQGMSHHCMDLGLYEAARGGYVDEFISALEQFFEEQNLALPTIFSQLTPLQNTFLHVASRDGCTDLAWLIIQYFPTLLIRANIHGNTPLHLAARQGHLDIVEIFVTFRNIKLRKDLQVNTNSDIKDATYTNKGMQMIVENDEGRTPLQLAHKERNEEVVEFLIKENVEEAYYVNKKGTSLLYMAILNGETERMKNILNIVSPYVDQNALDDQLTKGKSLVLAAIWSQEIEMLQELARQKPVLFKVKDEHAQKLVHFAELLGFQQGAHYLHSQYKLEIVLDSIVAGVVPESALHSYSLDAYSLSVIGIVDQKIENIRQLMHQTGRDERMKKLLCKNSHRPKQNQDQQFMDIKLYEAAKKGDVDGFICALENVSDENSSSPYIISDQTTRIGNTFLHVAASNGNEDLTRFILFYFPRLLRERNREGNTSKHDAARAGHLGVLDILVRFSNYHDQLHASKEYDIVGSPRTDTLWLKNLAGNTPLHEAFINNQRTVMDYLIKSSVEEAFYVNDEGKSGLYLAVEAAMVDVVKNILSNITSDFYEKIISELITGKSLLNAAIQRRNAEIWQEISRNIPAQIHVTEKDGQIALFNAVSTGFLEGVNSLLDDFKMDTFRMDSTGFYPVHVASKGGHVHTLQKLMQNCPDAEGFRNRKGQNILHVAAMYGKDNVVRFILQTPNLEFLINGIDYDGNTPLHLATINWHPKIVSSLTWDHRVKLTLVNYDGLTALYAAEKSLEPMTSFQQRLTWSALMAAGTPRAMAGNTLNKDRMSSKKGNLSGKDEEYNIDYSKDRINTLLLVATLIAAMTFAAGFTMPGDDSEPKQGQATLLRKLMSHTFVICDTIALYSSIMVVALIWAQLGDLTLVMNALRFALPLLGLSLTTMSLAFTAGVTLVVGNLTWLAVFVLIFGIISLASVLLLFIPFCFSYSSTSLVLRYITYYPFHLLVLASRSSDDRHVKEQ